MSFEQVFFLLPVVAGIALSNATPTAAEEPLVFISAFAPGEKGAIHAYKMNPQTGELKLVERTSDVEHPFFLAVSPDNKFLYSIHAPGKFSGKNNEFVSAFALEGRTGKLKLLNRQSSLGTASCYLDIDKSGKAVVVANYTTGSVASLPVKEDGSLGESETFIQHTGSSVNPQRQKEPHAHCSVISPDQKFVFAADLGLDKILAYQLDSETAKLTPAEQPFVRTIPGAGPRHLTFHPDGKQLYVINELKNSITEFDYNPESGMLIEGQTISTLPKDFSGTSHCADLKFTPDGRFLYGTNRGHDSIAAYQVDDQGKLTLLEIEPSLGKGPQNLAVTADGKYLICANMPGNNVVVFKIDDKTGKLSPAGDPIEIPSPSCIMIR
ncbi:MAG: 6-phosphogluconolactonase [Gimesia sp.]|uniref:6-phosphogluconolactonase n=1 Tax=Gimesia maris TaxID=122 RepID=A0A3D3R9H2_9PLAN|nr:6-phosphogluconolactonase [Gimesia sp.]HCO24732.1 6-phosphogluconolactonase [Gimesia maris]|tara:strand:- start:6938 stop:8080 length:1143 start_codon:yes stop_codon:yes gene_type:complete